MALTVIQVETILIYRTGDLMTAVGLDGTTVTGNNPDLVDPMGYAIRQTGGSVADITDITDSDLSGFAESDYDQLFDIGELRVLQNCYSIAATYIDTDIGPLAEKMSQMADKLNVLITSKQKTVDKQYSLYLKPMEIGYINLNTQARGDDPEMTS